MQQSHWKPEEIGQRSIHAGQDAANKDGVTAIKRAQERVVNWTVREWCRSATLSLQRSAARRGEKEMR